MGEDRQRIARQVLWMVFGALEPLELTALQEGLTVEPNIYEPIEDNRIFDSSIILDTCRSLLTVSRDRRGSEVVSFSHFSVKVSMLYGHWEEFYLIWLDSLFRNTLDRTGA